MKRIFIFLMASTIASCATQTARVPGEILQTVPGEIDPDSAYVFYAHGQIVEGDDPRPEHPDFGVYEFEAVRRALQDIGDFTLISHHRLRDYDFSEYVQGIEAQVRTLIAAGVAPEKITLIGFSMGGYLTAYASDRLKDTGVNTVLMGVCRAGDFPFETDLSLGGDVLSLYETSDVMLSCSAVGSRDDYYRSFTEISITTGRQHGAFYQPLDDWMVPLAAWLQPRI